VAPWTLCGFPPSLSILGQLLWANNSVGHMSRPTASSGPRDGGGYGGGGYGSGPPHGGGHGGPGGPPHGYSRKMVDPTGTTVRYLKDRIFRPEARLSACAVSCAAGASSWDMVPPAACRANAATSICARFVHLSFYKERCPVNAVVWTPEGRRLLAGGQNGMFTLWSGTNFTFETTQQAHEAAIRALVWNHTGEWMVSADHDGIIKYWAPTLNNVKEIPEAHPGAVIRELSFCPTDAKFCSCSDDATVKIWDFERGALDRLLIGKDTEGNKSHGWDVK
jgi:polyadenylation factor subunit 2